MMAAALTLMRLKETRRLYLYDTFEGMTPPTEVDVDFNGRPASDLLALDERRADRRNLWGYAPLEMVRAAMQSTGYDMDQVRFVRGPVEETIPLTMPDDIAILRLDTDWYSSTRHELEHLFPLVSPGGVLIIDDYGHYAGARKATEEYIQGNRIPLFLCRIDFGSRIAVKPSLAKV